MSTSKRKVWVADINLDKPELVDVRFCKQIIQLVNLDKVEIVDVYVTSDVTNTKVGR